MRKYLKRFAIWRHAGGMALLVAALLVGLALGNDFGVGADEALNSMVGGRALTAYRSPEGYRDYLGTGEILAQHGPSYFMLFTQAGRAVASVLPGWLPSDGRHLANYLVYLIGLASFYALARRLMPRRIAAMAAALFATQPVLFGLGFINAKDTPFMAMFLASLATGVWGVERIGGSAIAAVHGSPRGVQVGKQAPRGSRAELQRQAGMNPSDAAASSSTSAEQADVGHGDITRLRSDGPTPASFGGALRLDWAAASHWARAGLIASAAALALALLDLLAFDALRDLLKAAATWIYRQEALRGALSLLAQDIGKTPIEAYLPKVDWLYLAYGRMAVLSVALIVGFAIARRSLPRTCNRLLLVGGAGWPAVLLAGAVLGFTISVRPIAGLAGLLVSGYLLHQLRSRSAAPIFLYWVMAGAVAYETWPYLWDAPLSSFLASLALHTDVSGHEVLYRGAVYAPDALPWHYLPTLFGLQLTEPALLLLLFGLPGLLRKGRSGEPHAALLVGAGCWFALPLAATRMPGTGLYNGFRHVLFIVPPLLLAAGFGLQTLMDRVHAPVARWFVFGLLLLPGVVGIARMHPYEYAYFNAFAGGVRGTYEAFDQEYWCTSYREAMQYVNRAAEAGATIFFGRSMYAAVPFARADLNLTNQPASHTRADFMLYCTRFREDQAWVIGQPVYEIGREGAVFARVYQLGPGSQP